jgi:hypothetical protein
MLRVQARRAVLRFLRMDGRERAERDGGGWRLSFFLLPLLLPLLLTLS